MTNVPERGHWLREPLLHFLVIGTGIFLLYSLVRGGNETAPREIVISESRIEALAENFGRTWTRPPTPQELRGLVDDYVKEEVFYREAIAMGLDRDDTVIRRRLRQKMEFVSEDAAASAPAHGSAAAAVPRRAPRKVRRTFARHVPAGIRERRKAR